MQEIDHIFFSYTRNLTQRFLHPVVILMEIIHQDYNSP